VHSDFIQFFVRRRKVVSASFIATLPNLMHLRHVADYQEAGVSHRQAERAVRSAREFVAILPERIRCHTAQNCWTHNCPH
jgi:hypothetical protein